MIRIKTDKVLCKAVEVINSMEYFSFEDFESLMGKKKIKREDVYTLFEEEIQRHMKNGKIGTATATRTSMRSLQRFKKKLEFHQVTVDLLNQYETCMLNQGKSITTVGIYLTDLRTVFNLAISKGIIPKEKYPFGRRKYIIPRSRSTKKALSPEQLKAAYSYKPICKWEQWAWDIWFFSYLGQGINVTDIAHLTENNIDHNMIRFVRSKTADSSRAKITKVDIPITPEIQSIMDRHSGKSIPYLFPILMDAQSPMQKRRSIQQTTKMVNKYFSIIAAKVGISHRVTTYWARHTYATLLKRSNSVSIEFISEALGHTNIQTTRAYLDSFADDFKHEMANLSASFVKE